MKRFILFAAVIALVAFLHTQFPYVLQDENTRMRLLYLVMLLTLAGGWGWRTSKNRPMPKVARDACIWLAILLTLVFGYSFKDEFGQSRLMTELMPSKVQVNRNGTLLIKASSDGHFHAEGKVNGVAIRFLIDTGATDIVLSPDDARRAGIDTDAIAYDTYTSTANGTGSGARVTLGSLEVGNISLSQLPASVNKIWMSESLLGMSFLRRLHGFQVEGSRLVLMP